MRAVKVVPENTGKPAFDNAARNFNRKLHKSCRNRLRVNTPGGRRRKKEIMTTEYVNYINLILAIAQEKSKQRGTES